MMPPQLALVVWSALLVFLLRYASAKEATSSSALWVPVMWMSMMGSRSPAQWLGLVPTTAATAFEEGSPLDRSVYLFLIGVACCSWITWRWIASGFGQLEAVRQVLFWAMWLFLGVQVIFASFFLSMLGISRGTYMGDYDLK